MERTSPIMMFGSLHINFREKGKATCGLQMALFLNFKFEGEIESGFHLSEIYYIREMCWNYVRFLKEMENF